MIVFDYLIHNTDRHEKNAGLFRDSEDLEYTRFAPLFDNGSCLGWNHNPKQPDAGETKPFAKTRLEQLELVGNDLPDIPSREEIREIIGEVYQLFGIPEQQYAAACADLENSCRMLADYYHASHFHGSAEKPENREKSA